MNKLINCKNCGAPLHNNKCEYCGSEYEYVVELNDFQQVIELYIAGKKRKFYIEYVEQYPIYCDAYRTIDGSLFHKSAGNVIKLSLVSHDY